MDAAQQTQRELHVAQLLGHACLNIYNAYAQIYPEATYLHAVRTYTSSMYILNVVDKSPLRYLILLMNKQSTRSLLDNDINDEMTRISVPRAMPCARCL